MTPSLLPKTARCLAAFIAAATPKRHPETPAARRHQQRMLTPFEGHRTTPIACASSTR